MNYIWCLTPYSDFDIYYERVEYFEYTSEITEELKDWFFNYATGEFTWCRFKREDLKVYENKLHIESHRNRSDYCELEKLELKKIK